MAVNRGGLRSRGRRRQHWVSRLRCAPSADRSRRWRTKVVSPSRPTPWRPRGCARPSRRTRWSAAGSGAPSGRAPRTWRRASVRKISSAVWPLYRANRMAIEPAHDVGIAVALQVEHGAARRLRAAPGSPARPGWRSRAPCWRRCAAHRAAAPARGRARSGSGSGPPSRRAGRSPSGWSSIDMDADRRPELAAKCDAGPARLRAGPLGYAYGLRPRSRKAGCTAMGSH